MPGFIFILKKSSSF